MALGLVTVAGRDSYRVEGVMRENVRIVLGRSPSLFLAIHSCTTDVRSRNIFFLGCPTEIWTECSSLPIASRLSLSFRSKQQPYKMIHLSPMIMYRTVVSVSGTPDRGRVEGLVDTAH